ncbi:MAG TPA: aquaporin [Candidatus Dormibacteraeota bacterium]|nr:aquaporin [Candidatus Dormibacteraeota bacterium]
MLLRAKLLTELVGSFVFMSVIALSASAGSLAPVAIGLALAAMVYMGGHVSGAHYNPAVSWGLYLRRVIDARTMLSYWAAQLIGGVLAFGLADLISGHTPGIRPGAGVALAAALAAEVVFTAALVTVVLNVAATRETAGNSFYGLAIGFTVAAGAFAVGPISGAAFNPAVALGATVVAAIANHSSLGYLWLYVVGPLAGGAIGAAIHALQAPASPVAPEKSERVPPQTR